jgi:hypothetical protein
MIKPGTVNHARDQYRLAGRHDQRPGAGKHQLLKSVVSGALSKMMRS